MKKLSKKILSALTAAAMIFTVLAMPVGEIFGFVGETVKASAAEITEAQVWEKIEELKTLFPSGESYFTTTGKKCNSTQKVLINGYYSHTYCDECKLEYILKKNSKVANTIVPSVVENSGQWTCCAFAKFAYCYIFEHDLVGTKISSESYNGINDSFLSQLRPGDFLRFYKSGAENPGHYAIFLGYDDSYIYVYESNAKGYDERNIVTYNTKRKRTSYAKIIASTSNSYVDSLDLTSDPNNLGDKFTAPIITPSGKALTAGSDGNVTAQAWANSDSQKWTFTKNSSDNYYEIKNIEYNKNLDVSNGGNDNNVNIQIWEDNDTGSQRFGIYGSQGNYVIKPSYSTEFVIDSNGPNSNVHLYKYYSPTIDAQKFTIEADPNPAFSNIKVSSITNNNAVISATANKKPSTTTLKFQITVWPKDTGILGCLFSDSMQSFTFNSTYPNVGKTTNSIAFDLKNEETISAGARMTLNPDTEYYYGITSYYNEGGVTVSYASDILTFKTTASCTTHSYGSWVTKTAATCTADGLKSRTCSACGKVESATITKLGHSYTSSVTKAATCTATGVRTYKCSRCTSSYTESIAATGHSYTTGYEAAHPHKYYKKCSVCSTVEYTGSTQYLYNCASCTNLTVPTITSITSPANINKAVTIKWTASTSDKLGHYWITIRDPSGTAVVETKVDKSTPTYTFTPTVTGEYSVTVAATPTGSPDGSSSLWQKTTITVHDIATYYEATHPHKYVNYCKSCDYMVYIGTNLGYYEKCQTCHDSVAPSKPVVKNVASSYVVGDSIIVKWDATTNTTHYNITLWKKDANGEYKSIEWVPYAENGHTFTGYGVGEYGISIQSYNSGYFYQYSENYRDWVHTSSSSVRFTIKPETVKNFSVSSKTANTITLSWTANTTADGYIIQQMKSGTWTNIANIDSNSTVTYTVSGLAASTSYSFRAVAYKTVNGTKLYSGYTGSTPAITLPASITDFAITGRDSSSLTLSWAKNTSADGYVIQQQIDGVWSNIAVLKSNATVTYKVTDLAPNTLYRFRMVAFKSHDGTKLYSKYTGAMSGYTAPAIVSGLTATADSETQLTVSWSKVASANGYVVDIYKDGKWSQLAKITSNATTSYKSTGLVAGTQYKFRIKSYATNGTLTIYSTYSSPVIAVTKPAQVTGLTITANGSNSVSLSWNKVNASGYVIQCLKNNEWVTVGNIKDSTTTSYTVTGLTANSSYKFRMVAYATVNNNSVYGKYTAALAGRTAPAKVANLTMTNRGTDFISVRWDKDEKADGYMVYLYDGTSWKCVKTMATNSAVSHKITGLESGKTYKITVKAIKTVDDVKYISDPVTISATTL